RERRGAHLVRTVAADASDRNRASLAAGPHPRLRPGEGEGGAGRQSALRTVGGRSRQPAAGATPDRGGVKGGRASLCPPYDLQRSSSASASLPVLWVQGLICPTGKSAFASQAFHACTAQ